MKGSFKKKIPFFVFQSNSSDPQQPVNPQEWETTRVERTQALGVRGEGARGREALDRILQRDGNQYPCLPLPCFHQLLSQAPFPLLTGSQHALKID
jgi:hypothetical protein